MTDRAEILVGIILLLQLLWIVRELSIGFKEKRLKYRCKKIVNSFRGLLSLVWTFFLVLFSVMVLSNIPAVIGAQVQVANGNVSDLVFLVFIWTMMGLIIWMWKCSNEPLWKYSEEEHGYSEEDIDPIIKWLAPFTKWLGGINTRLNERFKWLKKLDDSKWGVSNANFNLVFYIIFSIIFVFLPLLVVIVHFLIKEVEG